MTAIMGESAYQLLLTGMIMAGSLWGWFLSRRMIPLFTGGLTRHSRNTPSVKNFPKQHES